MSTHAPETSQTDRASQAAAVPLERRSVTERAAALIAEYGRRELDPPLAMCLKQRVLDALVAGVSGATLVPGQAAHRYARNHLWPGAANLFGSDITAHPELAALVNGMCAHADETDDVNDLSPMHPGASIVPAALAMAQVHHCDGDRFLRAVNAGYDLGCAFPLGAWPEWKMLQGAVRSAHGIGQSLGAAAAAAVVAGLPEDSLLTVFSYTCQLASGFSSFYRDRQHIEKAFACAGMQARNGIAAVNMAAAGFTGVPDVFDTSPSAFDAFGDGAGDPERFLSLMQQGRHVQNIDLKAYPVGMPIQAAAEAMEKLLAKGGFAAADVERVVCRLPRAKVHVVNGRHMPDINLQYVLAVMIADGKLDFHNARDYQRRGSELQDLIKRIELVGDPELDPVTGNNESSRRAIVEVSLRDGSSLSEHVNASRGSRLNPMDWNQVARKARNVLGAVGVAESVIERLIGTVQSLEQVKDMNEIGWLVAETGTAKGAGQ